ncbi:hypothetical protein OROGR_026594 [Orobanche gracilis]
MLIFKGKYNTTDQWQANAHKRRLGVFTKLDTYTC